MTRRELDVLRIAAAIVQGGRRDITRFMNADGVLACHRNSR